MSLTTVIGKIDKFLISCGFANPQINGNGYYFYTINNVKIYFYPSNDGVRISVIPTARKYNIAGTKRIEVDGVGLLEIEVNPQLSNPRMNIYLSEHHLSIDRLNNTTSYMLSCVDDIYGKFENNIR
ncbi:hypothetical protein [Paenibacillus odorifer]|uniref:Uncharacterized protein n=1 Tax=Paenibacillus odorifer TaxID=189426 RepID=A0A1R0Y6X7_9BACL|nr:hypothetical protein [Paenibacillus odorifer]OMD43032.1 hypothetical protein BSK52_05905 [Paenibacillus odorifer]